LSPWEPGILTWQAYAPYLSLGGSLSQVLEDIAGTAFFRSIEIPSAISAKDRAAIRLLAQQQGWRVMVWASDAQARDQLDLGSLDETTLVRSRARFRQLLNEAREAGASRFGFCSPPGVASNHRSSAVRILTTELTSLAQEAESMGIALHFEGLDVRAHKRGLLGSSAELAQLARSVRAASPRFGLVWDSAHTALNGEDLLESYRQLSEHVTTVHLSEAIIDLQHRDYGDWHLPVGSGSVLTGPRITSLFTLMRQQHRQDIPLTVAIEEWNTDLAKSGRDGLARGWSYTAENLP
jgi:sugar phosphate isomerase/epimerase